MMLDSAQIRRRGALDFEGYYDYACAMQGTAPLPATKVNLSQGMLDFSGDLINLADWTPILASLAINQQLRHVAIRSCYLNGLFTGAEGPHRSSRKKIPALHSKNMTFQLCKAVQKCLSVSANLRTLQLHGLPLRERDLITLTKGLAKSGSLENLSLACCPIADEGLEAICQSVKYSPSIKTVDFTGCNITWRGAEHMAAIIKHQAMRRHSAAWAESLRYRRPELEGMAGLRRVTLNGNILMGDRGAAVLAQELLEDLWVKAVDLQKCGLSNEGARVLLDALQSNSTLCVLDIRRNPLVDNDLVKAVIKRVLMNTNSQDSQYLWIKPPATKEFQKHKGLTRRMIGNVGKGKATFRIGSRRTSSTGCVTKPPRPGASACIPWRTAARAGKQRGLPSGVTKTDHSFQGAASVKVTVETESESEEAECGSQSPLVMSVQEKITRSQHNQLQAQCSRLQVELEECRLSLAEERSARLKANSRLVELELENSRLRSINFSLSEALQAPPLRSSALEDDTVLDSIETSFHKFHAFLDLLKDAGLGQLASLAGIDQSDFGLLGRPQLSSTSGRPAGVTGEREQDVADRRGDGLHALLALQPNGAISGLPASPMDSLEHGALQEARLFPVDHTTSAPTALGQPVVSAAALQRSLSPLQPNIRQALGSEDGSVARSASYSKGSRGDGSVCSIGSHGKGSASGSSFHGNSSPGNSSRASSLSQGGGAVRVSERSGSGLAGY